MLVQVNAEVLLISCFSSCLASSAVCRAAALIAFAITVHVVDQQPMH